MATNFPTSVDAFTNPTANDSLNAPSHATQHINSNDAIEAIEGYIINGTGAAWQSWAPTLSGGWLNGNGVWEAYYSQIGKTVHVYGNFVLGSTTTKGTNMLISLPVTAKNSLQVFPAYSVVGATQYSLSIRLESTTQLRVITHDVVTYLRSVQITATVPATWATGNTIAFQLTYEAA